MDKLPEAVVDLVFSHLVQIAEDIECEEGFKSLKPRSLANCCLCLRFRASFVVLPGRT